jgi:Tol biopolymer transport system component
LILPGAKSSLEDKYIRTPFYHFLFSVFFATEKKYSVMKYKTLYSIALVILSIILSVLLLNSCTQQPKETAKEEPAKKDTTPALLYPGEKHLANMRQLTFGGDNAEAYFSSDGSKIVFQARNKSKGENCDQIFYSPLENFKPAMLSNGHGRTTCSYFLPGDSLILYATTAHRDSICPEEKPRQHGDPYTWSVNGNYDIFICDLQGKIRKQLTNTKGYDAEATVSPAGDKIVFTSVRSGDIELYTMNIDGSNVKQITHETGYDGGAFFSPDGSKIIFRASRPSGKEEVKQYKDLLKKELVMPTKMELFICDADGKNQKQITRLGNANWAPFFKPGSDKIIFSSNHHATKHGLPFNLFMINPDGSGLEQITFDKMFDAFPVFSPDGKKLIFSSMRNNNNTHDNNLFIADWVD